MVRLEQRDFCGERVEYRLQRGGLKKAVYCLNAKDRPRTSKVYETTLGQKGNNGTQLAYCLTALPRLQ